MPERSQPTHPHLLSGKGRGTSSAGAFAPLGFVDLLLRKSGGPPSSSDGSISGATRGG